MKRVLLAALLMLLWWTPVGTLQAGPLRQSPAIGITSPQAGAVVRGTVPIVGTAADSNFWKYEVYYAAEPNPSDRWTGLGGVHEKQVASGLLEAWETNGLPDGSYSIKLRVVDRTGNYREIVVQSIVVANAMPTDTPTPRPTATVTPTATPAATPTFTIPTSALAQPTFTPTLARPTRSALPDLGDSGEWRSSLCMGVQAMALVLLALAVIFALRKML